MTSENVRWWPAIEPGTPTELGFVRVDRVDSSGDWGALPHDQAIARRSEYVTLIESEAEGFGAVVPLAWQGDGVMAFVAAQSPYDDAAATAGVLAITLTEQLLRSGFAARVAAHAGRVAFQPETGKMSDPEIDRAGHLEEDCPANAAALSEDVYLALPEQYRRRCGYLGTTVRDGTIAYVFPAAAISRRDPARFAPAVEDLVPLERRFLRYLESADVRRLRYVGFRLRRPNPPSLDILDVFTPLDVEEHAPTGATTIDLEEGWRPGQLVAPWTRSVEVAAVPRPFVDVFGPTRHLVVLGDPGSGKSTLLRWLAVNAGLGRHASRRRLGTDERLVPLLLPVGRLFELRAALTRETAGGVNVLDVIVRYFRERNVVEDAAALRRLLVWRLEEGGCLVLLDGLDEVSSESRLDVTRWLEDFAAAYRENRFVVTSRIFGYAGVSLPQAATVVLRPFTGEQVRTYVVAWHRAYRAWESNLSPDAAELDRPASDAQAEQLLQVIESDGRLRALASNPFLLSAIALVHRAEGQLPTHRVQLYEIFSRALCETWDAARRLAAGDRASVRRIEYETEAIPILGRLAFWLHEHHAAGAAPEAEIRETLVAALVDERDVARDKATAAAAEFLRRAGEDLQILVPRGPGLFGFMHLTFQEFFAAAYLHARERFEAEARLRWYDARWEEVILLGVGMLAIVQKRPAAAGAFARGVLGWQVAEYPFLTEILHKQVLLAALCAADGPNLDRPTYETTAHALVDLLLRDPRRATRSRGRRTLRRLHGTPFGDVVLPILARELRDNADADTRANAAEALGALRDARAFDLVATAFQRDPADHVRQKAAEALGQIGDRRALDLLVDGIGDPKARLGVVNGLRMLAPARLGEVLTELLQSPDRQTRVFAIFSLRRGDGAHAVERLIKLFGSDPGNLVRAGAARALGRLGTPDAVPNLLQAVLHDPDDLVRALATLALCDLGVGNLLGDLLQTARQDRAGLVRSVAARQLFRSDDPRLVDVLMAMLQEDPDQYVRAEAAWALAQRRNPAERTAAMNTLTSDNNPWVRQLAAKGLGESGDPSAVESLSSALREDPEADVRAAAAEALGKIGDLRALQPLVDAFQRNTREVVREAIVEALWMLSDRLAAPQTSEAAGERSL